MDEKLREILLKHEWMGEHFRCQCGWRVENHSEDHMYVQWLTHIEQLERAQPAMPPEAQIKRMVDRFLVWQLPENFNPDAGISFKRNKAFPMPTGTNLFDAIQAEEMVRYLFEEQPACGQAERDARIMQLATDNSFIYYGPHPCENCSRLICKVAKEQGSEAFDYPTGPIYPNTNWTLHVCAQPATPRVTVSGGALPNASQPSWSEPQEFTVRLSHPVAAQGTDGLLRELLEKWITHPEDYSAEGVARMTKQLLVSHDASLLRQKDGEWIDEIEDRLHFGTLPPETLENTKGQLDIWLNEHDAALKASVREEIFAALRMDAEDIEKVRARLAHTEKAAAEERKLP